MPFTSIKLNVSVESQQGGRLYMEDYFSFKIKWIEENKSLDYGYFAIFDGHGGKEAAAFAKEHLFDEISKHKGFWSDDEDLVLKAIKDGFLSTHKLMSKQVSSWPMTMTGYLSTAGTTASIAIIKNNRLYIGHVGDSAVVIGRKNNVGLLEGTSLTKEHKPDDAIELQRIESCGGQVVSRAGVKRIVWCRPKASDSSGQILRSMQVDKVPFLAVARSLGDFWSYSSEFDKYIVSPEPDVSVHCLDTRLDVCLIIASDGLWNMLKPQEAVYTAHSNDSSAAALLVSLALRRWSVRKLRADNTTALVVSLQSPGGVAALPPSIPMSDLPLTPLHRVQSTQLRLTPPVLIAAATRVSPRRSIASPDFYRASTRHRHSTGAKRSPSSFRYSPGAGGLSPGVAHSRVTFTVGDNLSVGLQNYPPKRVCRRLSLNKQTRTRQQLDTSVQ